MSNVITSIQFKRGTKATLESRLVPGDLGVPARGEPIYETDTNRMKIGDGVKSYAELDYFGNVEDSNLVLEGYYDPSDQSFYDAPAEDLDRHKLPEWTNKLYRDLSTNIVYYFRAIGRFIVLANSIKLYDTHGQNTDGAMTQKAVTDSIDKISFKVDEEDERCLVLSKPW